MYNDLTQPAPDDAILSEEEQEADLDGEQDKEEPTASSSTEKSKGKGKGKGKAVSSKPKGKKSSQQTTTITEETALPDGPGTSATAQSNPQPSSATLPSGSQAPPPATSSSAVPPSPGSEFIGPVNPDGPTQNPQPQPQLKVIELQKLPVNDNGAADEESMEIDERSDEQEGTSKKRKGPTGESHTQKV